MRIARAAKSGRWLGLWLACVFLPAAAWAQTHADAASLRVIVFDPAGAAIEKTLVRLRSGAGKEQRRATNQHGEASFLRLPVGEYQISIEAPGFNPQTLIRVALPLNGNRLTVRLEVAPVTEQVEVAQDKREQQLDARSNAFSTVLTAEQIAQLPDDPEELAAALRAMAGPGAEIYVNGFRGGKLPPKSHIAQIRFRLTPFAAEYHSFGGTRVDIFTKPGVNQWRGGFNAAFRDEALNARNALAPFRGPEQTRRFAFDLSGPLWRNGASLFLFADGVNSYDAKTIVAALPEGDFNSLIRRPVRRLNLSARLEHALSKTHTLRGEYQRNASRQGNLGVGDFDLPERAYALDSTEHLLRLADSGPLSKRLVNEFRFQGRWQATASQALTDQPALLVPGAFQRGGAQINLDRHAAEFELADNLDLLFGQHGLRTGALLEITRQHSRELNNAHGTFIFASLDAFRAGRPTTFTQRVGEPEIRLTQYQLGWYAQDDWRVSQSVSLSFGLRHELQNHLRDRNNFAPRIGFAWSPFKHGRTALRGGAGIFYDWFGATTFEQTLRVDGVRQRDLVVRNPGFPNPFVGSEVIVLPGSRIVVDPQLRLPTVYRYSLSVQQQLTNRINAHANYVYQRGAHLLRGRNINAPRRCASNAKSRMNC
jgi:hypothetical protein